MPTKKLTSAEKAQLGKKYAEGRAELQTMHKKIRDLEAEKQRLNAAIAQKELQAKRLHREIDVALKSGGMLLADLPNQGKARHFDAGRAYVEAVESGDKTRATFLFKNHKAEIFAFASRH